jgi:hypothetical protein
MAAANDGLIGVVGIQVKAPPAEDLCENVPRRGDTLSGRASDTDSEGLFHNTLSAECWPIYDAPALGQAQLVDFIRARETPCPKVQAALPGVAGVYTQSFGLLVGTAFIEEKTELPRFVQLTFVPLQRLAAH